MTEIINSYTITDIHNIIGNLKKPVDKSSPLIISESLVSLGLLEGTRSHKILIKTWADILEEELQDYSWAISTFNYDFPKTHIFNRKETQSQLGPLSKYFCKKYPHKRTLDPIFSYVLMGNMKYWDESKLLEHVIVNPFQEKSFFHFLIGKNARYVNLGIVPSYQFYAHAFTFVHLIEHQINVGYRYVKLFPGLIENTQHVYHYRVRPIFCNPIFYENHYDQFMTSFTMGTTSQERNKLCIMNIDTVYQYLYNNMLENEFFLLKSESIQKIKSLQATHDYPFITDE